MVLNAEMTSHAPARFPKTARVRSSAQYSQVFESARRFHHPALTLHAAAVADREGDAGARLGLAVSRKVDARAVGRNRIKRVLRDQFRKLRGHLPAGDYVVVARVAARHVDNTVLRETFLRTLTRAGALPAPSAPGTMRPVTDTTSPSSLSSLPRNTPKPDVPAG